MSFELHPRLATDCHVVTDLGLSTLLLMDDARWPWCILVPRIAGLRDLHDVPKRRRKALFDEIDAVSRALVDGFGAGKINVAALGNQVPQLHVHVIARHSEDPAWPRPVWGIGSAERYPDGERERVCATLRASLASG